MTSTTLEPRTAAPGRLLIVDDRADARQSMADILRQAGHQVVDVANVAQALRLCDDECFDVVVSDLQMPGQSGLDLVRALARRRYGAQVLIVTAFASVATAVEAMRHGAFDYIEKPFDAERLEGLVTRALEHGRLLDGRGNASLEGDEPVMVGDSPAMRQLRSRIVQVGPTDETVLITGESGTGKELVARAVHAMSLRRRNPLVSLNCPVLSAHLMESELFGHERGAFTGADYARTGRFELADHGTILLDEISEMEPNLQAKLLRVLQERCFERVGSSKTQHIDVRVLATSNRDLRAEARAGRFREDLYFRLAVVPVPVPPLRERREDLPDLAAYFLLRAARRLRRDPCELAPSATELLCAYHWPGNVRELENLVTRASVLASGSLIEADALRDWLIDNPHAQADRHNPAVEVGLSLEQMERQMIEATLEHFAGHRAKAAKALGIGIRTLSGKLKTYGYAPRTKQFARAG